MVFDRRNGIYRGFVFAVIGCLIAAGILWFALKPAKPILPRYEQTKAAQADYRAGGRECAPEILAKLPPAQSLSKRDACDDAAEQHRLQRDDLVQQTRAADAAREGVFLNYTQSVLALAGVILGLFTLFAAGAAAWFAKRAADETKRSADAADNALIEAGKTNETHLRPWLQVEIINKPRMAIAKGSPRIPLRIRVTNKGNSPAVAISYIPNLVIGYEPDIQLNIDFSHLRKEAFILERSLFQGESETFDAWVEHHGDPITVSDAYLTVSVFYKTTFSDEWRTTAVFYQIYDAKMDGERLIDFTESLASADFKMVPWETMPGLIE